MRPLPNGGFAGGDEGSCESRKQGLNPPDVFMAIGRIAGASMNTGDVVPDSDSISDAIDRREAKRCVLRLIAAGLVVLACPASPGDVSYFSLIQKSSSCPYVM